MNLRSILSEDMCCILTESTKNENLFTLINLITHKLSLNEKDSENLMKGIFYREQLMSTGIGLGIGIPHIRFEGVSEPILAVGVRKEGIPDYETMDNEIIKIVVMIIVGKFQHKEHIRLLSLIVSMFKKKGIKERLVSAPDGSEIYTIMAGQSDASDI
ncbi:MAG: PTS sugar transporter subunit IIA [Spirochaetales bacterium]|nr:PTS sugar transporter subunit IIA [Spirochaetales bacterium]